MWLMIFEKAILEISSMKKQFWKNVFLREQFQKSLF